MYKIIGANQVEYGPISADQVRQWIAEGRINAQTSAQAAGDTGWKPISSFPEFASSFPSAQPTPPPLGANPPPLSPGYGMSGGDGRAHAESEVSGPAIGLMVTGVMGIGYGVLGILGNIFGVTMNSLNNFNGMNGMNNPQMMQLMQMSTGALGIIMSVLKVVLGAFIVYGALKMKSLQQHGLALGAAIVAVIPCISPCCCIGIPIGIWALIVLNKPEVRGYFS
jgi:hypothetical protein